MSALYTVAEIRQIEVAALAALPASTLMQRAGQACANSVLELTAHDPDGTILILAGPGNNGGDALQAAYYLAQSDLAVSVALYADETRYSTDALHALQCARASGALFLDINDPRHLGTGRWSLVVDGLFGIGLQRPISGTLRSAIEYIDSLQVPILAIDVPSGLDADTGTVVGGSAGIAVHADHTLTFIGDKTGLHTCDGVDYCGSISVDTLAIDSTHFPPPHAWLSQPSLFSASLRPRRGNSHKGSNGDVLVLGGAPGMGGAVMLAARSAAYGGAGRVLAGFLEQAPAYDPVHPELMLRLAADLNFGNATLVVGTGLGTSRQAHDLLSRALHASGPLVLDADALNLIAAESGLQHVLLHARSRAVMITPHPLEAARLLALDVGQIQHDRPQAARQLAQRFGVVAVLKGAGSVIAYPDGDIIINTSGNPALASGGTGDVLAGLCGALLAQGWPLRDAAPAAVWLHGKAADQLVASGSGPIGLTASELAPAIRTLINKINRDNGHRTAFTRSPPQIMARHSVSDFRSVDTDTA